MSTCAQKFILDKILIHMWKLFRLRGREGVKYLGLCSVWYTSCRIWGVIRILLQAGIESADVYPCYTSSHGLVSAENYRRQTTFSTKNGRHTIRQVLWINCNHKRIGYVHSENYFFVSFFLNNIIKKECLVPVGGKFKENPFPIHTVHL